MLRVLDLFSGLGMWSLGLERTGGFKTVAFCESDPFCRRVLAKHWPTVPCHDDVETRSFIEDEADVIAAGWPCQDISYAGRGAGLAGARSGLFWHVPRAARLVRAKYVLLENVAAVLDRGLHLVLGAFTAIGYDAEWSVVSACALGAPHMRRRVFVVAYPHGQHGWQGIWNPASQQDRAIQAIDRVEGARVGFRERLANPSALYRDADAAAFGVDRNRAIGNSIYHDIPELIGRAILDARCVP